MLRAGAQHNCGIDAETNEIICSGCEEDNVHGACESPLGKYTALAAGDTHTCGVRDDGTVVCWGCEGLDDELSEICDEPSGVFRVISSEGLHTCGIHNDNTLHCWGHIVGGSELTPPSGSYTALDSGGAHTCALGEQGALHCWGCDFDFDSGQCNVPDGQDWLLLD